MTKPPPPLRPGEYAAGLNGVCLHYTVRGTGPVLIAHSGGSERFAAVIRALVA